MAPLATSPPRLRFCIWRCNHALGGGEQRYQKAARMMAALREGNWHRRHAVMLASQLPEKTEDGMIILRLATQLVTDFLADPEPFSFEYLVFEGDAFREADLEAAALGDGLLFDDADASVIPSF